jgi:hypothetical protein
MSRTIRNPLISKRGKSAWTTRFYNRMIRGHVDVPQLQLGPGPLNGEVWSPSAKKYRKRQISRARRREPIGMD